MTTRADAGRTADSPSEKTNIFAGLVVEAPGIEPGSA